MKSRVRSPRESPAARAGGSGDTLLQHASVSSKKFPTTFCCPEKQGVKVSVEFLLQRFFTGLKTNEDFLFSVGFSSLVKGFFFFFSLF